MEKKYTYKNAVVRIVIPDNGPKNISEATKRFLKKVLLERKGVEK